MSGRNLVVLAALAFVAGLGLSRHGAVARACSCIWNEVWSLEMAHASHPEDAEAFAGGAVLDVPSTIETDETGVRLQLVTP